MKRIIRRGIGLWPKRPCRDKSCGNLYEPEGKYQQYCQPCIDRRHAKGQLNASLRTKKGQKKKHIINLAKYGKEISRFLSSRKGL